MMLPSVKMTHFVLVVIALTGILRSEHTFFFYKFLDTVHDNTALLGWERTTTDVFDATQCYHTEGNTIGFPHNTYLRKVQSNSIMWENLRITYEICESGSRRWESGDYISLKCYWRIAGTSINTPWYEFRRIFESELPTGIVSIALPEVTWNNVEFGFSWEYISRYGDTDDRSYIYNVGLYGTRIVTSSPTARPTKRPTKFPTEFPTGHPIKSPSKYPTNFPSKYPTKFPSKYPSKFPSKLPTKNPTVDPTKSPSKIPSNIPTKSPSKSPINSPTKVPIYAPTMSPTSVPTILPTHVPTLSPTRAPIMSPTRVPTMSPTHVPTMSTPDPTISPTHVSTISPSSLPTTSPSSLPTTSPSSLPTTSPSIMPTILPSTIPTISPPDAPTISPTVVPISNNVGMFMLTTNATTSTSKPEKKIMGAFTIPIGLLCAIILFVLCICILIFIGVHKKYKRQHKKESNLSNVHVSHNTPKVVDAGIAYDSEAISLPDTVNAEEKDVFTPGGPIIDSTVVTGESWLDNEGHSEGMIKIIKHKEYIDTEPSLQSTIINNGSKPFENEYADGYKQTRMPSVQIKIPNVPSTDDGVRVRQKRNHITNNGANIPPQSHVSNKGPKVTVYKSKIRSTKDKRKIKLHFSKE